MKVKRYIFISLGIVLVCAYFAWIGCFLSATKGEQVCEGVSVYVKDSADFQFVSTREITELMRRSGVQLLGTDMDHIITADIEEVLESYRLLKTIDCYKTLNNKIALELTQRKPKFRIIGVENYYVDTDREIMPIALGYTIHVPVVTGAVTKEMSLGELYDLIEYMEDDSFHSTAYTQINVTCDGKVELTPRVGDYKILLGRLADGYKSRLEKLKRLYVDGFSVIGWPDYSTIDLQYEDQVVCKKR